MRIFRFLFVVLLATLVLTVSDVAYADESGNGGNAPTDITSFTITPSSGYAGETITYRIDFTVTDVNSRNTICIYYSDTNFQPPIDAVGDLTSDLGDSYIQTNGSGGPPEFTTNCPGVSGYYVNEWSVGSPHPFSGGGDYLTFSITVPNTSAGNKTFISQQRNTGLINTLNTSFTVNSPPSTVYVSNTSGCGGNSPCYTGADALQSAFDVITDTGTVNIYGTWSQGGGNTATLNNTDNKSVTLTGFNTPLIENGGGTCSGAMIENNGSGTLTVTGLTIDGTCGSGSRSAGILNSGSGTTIVKDNANTIRDFTGNGNAGVEVSNGTMVVQGNSFDNNYYAMEQNGGTLYAFANNVTNSASYAATGTSSNANVKCNYWGSANINGFGSDYDERLGAPVSSYIEGTGALSLGNASLAAGTGNQVLINLGRDTSNPPFNNGTTSGLGALVSDFFAACSTRGGSAVGTITITGDSVTPDSDGFRLYEIQNAADCSPADNTACWDYAGAVDGSGNPTGSAHCTTQGCAVTDEHTSEGHFVVGNAMDPTIITLENVSASSSGNTWLPFVLLVGSVALVSGTVAYLRKRRA